MNDKLNRSNEYHTPFFKSLIHQVEKMYECDFYGYVNGDILFHSNLTKVLVVIKNYIQQHKLKERGMNDELFDK